MKTLKFFALIAAAALIIAGCGSKEPATDATQVENPSANDGAEVSVQPAPDADGYVTSDTGLKYKDIKVGEGPEVHGGNTVEVHYKGWLDNGKVFDTSKQPGREPFLFTVGNNQVISGWEEGIQGMKKGGVRELIIPGHLGYGPEGSGPIPPNATLHFTIELLDIR